MGTVVFVEVSMTASSRRRALVVAAFLTVLTVFGAQLLRAAAELQAPEPVTAIVGGTVIDGNGGPPLKDATVVIEGKRIKSVGPRASMVVPKDAVTIDATGKFITPGFVDTNVHVSLYGGGAKDRKETSVRYQDASARLTLEAAQMQLRYGITTIRDSYGALLPLIEVRDAIARGAAIGPRLLAAGNIVGWGGPYSISFAQINERDLSLYEEQFTDFIAQGAGEDLMTMYPEELRVAINKYLDKGPNFIKYGGTSHWSNPTFIGFSPDAQKVIVDETHKRGLFAETHATSPEGLKLAIQAGIDLIQHPEVLDGREMSDALIAQIRDRKIIGSMLVSSITGEAWKKHLKDKEAAKRRIEERDAQTADSGLKKNVARSKTSAEKRRDDQALGVEMEMRRRNAQKIINAGCVVTVGTDNYAGASPEYTRTPKPMWQEPGLGTIIAIEGLVELGMTPAQAIVSASRNGAIASKGLKEFGTIEAGKVADILVLGGDPLTDISNIRKLAVLIRDGKTIDRTRLPTDPVMYRPE
ncbi:MAG: hydrolase [Acidobacteria bacterium]|nr:MAG: hydrolase [Acidobacteriota bacterium]